MEGLDNLLLFRHVVEHGGISAAARALGQPKSSVARHIQALEQQLRTPLFHRGGRSLVLTGFGRECYQQSLRVVREAEKVFDMADRMAASPSGSLRVAWPPMLGQLAFESLAMEYLAAAPDVTLHLEETNDILDPRSIAADFVLHASFQPLSNVDAVARRVLKSPFVLVAAPAVIEAHGRPLQVDQLQQFPGIGFGNKSTSWRWQLRRGRERASVPFSPRMTTTQLSALMAGASAGLGVAAVPAALCGEHFREGSLIALLPDWHPPPVEVYAIYPAGKTLSRAAREFMALIERRLPQMLQQVV